MKLNILMSIFVVLFAVSTMSEPAKASEDNYNSDAGGYGQGTSNANCNSALFQSCGGQISTAPSPVLGGGIAFFAAAGFLTAMRRRKQTQFNQHQSE